MGTEENETDIPETTQVGWQNTNWITHNTS